MAELEEVSLSVRNEEDVSPDCLAWADSCIISFPDDSVNNNWGTFRDALTEIIDIHPEMFVASSTGARYVLPQDEEMTEPKPSDLRTFEAEADCVDSSNNVSSEEVSEIISMLRFESDPSKNSLQDHYFAEPVAENGTTCEQLDNASKDLEGVERIEDDGEGEEELELLSSQVFKDEYMNPSIQDNFDDLNVAEDPVKVNPQEIFKVWDLEIVRDDDDEEDGLVLQLKKALDQPRPLNDDHVVADKTINDLIAGISDLSLVETFK